MTLPTFLIIGAQKAGTTSLHVYLRHHPDVFVAPGKELNFFVESANWPRGISWYALQFAGADGCAAVGESSPSYTMHPLNPGVPERIGRTLGDVRLVYLLRHPIERMRSAYTHALAGGAERRPIGEALLDDERYLVPSLYALQLERYLTVFDRSDILLLTSEDLRDRRLDVLKHIARFLGIREDWSPPNIDRELNRSRDKRMPRGAARRIGGLLLRSGVPQRPPDRRSLPRWLTVPIDPSLIAVDDALQERLADRLRLDLARLRAHMDPAFDAWGLL